MENREMITINIQLNTDKDGNQTSAMSLSKVSSTKAYNIPIIYGNESIYNEIKKHLIYSDQQNKQLLEEIERLKSELSNNQNAYGELHDTSAKNYNNQLRLTNHYKAECDRLQSELKDKDSWNSKIINYIEKDAEIAIPIERMFIDAKSITKKQYGIVLLEILCEELRSKFLPNKPKTN